MSEILLLAVIVAIADCAAVFYFLAGGIDAALILSERKRHFSLLTLMGLVSLFAVNAGVVAGIVRRLL
jgi:hypothetical protein